MHIVGCGNERPFMESLFQISYYSWIGNSAVLEYVLSLAPLMSSDLLIAPAYAGCPPKVPRNLAFTCHFPV